MVTNIIVEPVYLALGAKIAMLREVLGLTQDDLAKRMKCTRANIANLETGRGRVLLHQVKQYADALGTTPKHLLVGIYL